MKRILFAAVAVASAACLAGPGQVCVTASYSENPCVDAPRGTPYVQRTAEPWCAFPGRGVTLVVSRLGGADGKIAVKYKTQSSTAILLKDFGYVKDVLEWEDGDSSDREIFIDTYANDFSDADLDLVERGLYYPKLMRIKFSTLATGSYAGNAVPSLPVPKTYIDLVSCESQPAGFVVPGVTPDSDAGMIRITRAESVSGDAGNVSFSRTAEPWMVTAGDVMRLCVSRVGGSSGRIAVKYKTQTSTALCGTDFAYVKDVLEWEDGDASDKYVDIPTEQISHTGCKTQACVRRGNYCCGFGSYVDTSCVDYYGCPSSLQMRVKFVRMTTGSYEGCRVPAIEKEKVYMTILYGSTTRPEESRY